MALHDREASRARRAGPWIARDMAILLLTIPTLPQGKVIARMRAVVRPPHSTKRCFGILL
jgi:hypothetical protein